MESLSEMITEIPIPHITLDNMKETHILAISTTIIIIILSVLYGKRKNLKARNELFKRRLQAFNPEPLITTSEIYSEPLICDIKEVAEENPKPFSTMENLVYHNYLNLFEDEGIKQLAIDCIRCCGVGSCGPRGFYGTLGTHLDLEKHIADFLGLEEAVLYAYSVSTMSSVIMAYCKKGDVIFFDENLVENSIQGIKSCRATMVPYKHNDIEDLKEKIKNTKSTKKEEPRKFLIVEGIYYRTGKICPLPQLIKLCHENHIRIILDESLSLGTLGKHGRGLSEHFNIDPSGIDLIVGSLECGISSIGGFCVGSSYVIEHQRLSGLGYCFSASPPPLLCTAANRALELFETTPEMFESLHTVAAKLHIQLIRLDGINVLSDRISPRKVFKFEHVATDVVIQKCKLKRMLMIPENDTLVINIYKNMSDETISKIFEILQWASA